MRKTGLVLALLPAVISSPALAVTVSDPVGDILPSFVGTGSPDLDVTSFSVDFNPGTNLFTLSATFAGAIDPTLAGFYVIGVNTGTGANAPFGSIGEPNVTFNQVIVVQKNGTATLSGNALAVALAGNMFSVDVPLGLLPPTVPGLGPRNYGFNLWPREGAVVTGNSQITDFAPENALLRIVPEPATWLMMLLGFAMVGTALRFRRARVVGEADPIPSPA